MLPLYSPQDKATEGFLYSKVNEKQDGELPEKVGSPWNVPEIQGHAESNTRQKADESPCQTRSRGKRNGLIVLFIFAYALFFAMRHIQRARCRHESVRIWAEKMMKEMSAISLPSQFTLPSGDTIPSIGLGVWRAAPNEVGEAVKVALEAGYRHIDDAWIYGNEREVGNAIKKSSVPREDMWLTSKLWNTFHSPEHVEWAVDDTLEKLGTSYIDLYLIHWPVAFNEAQEVDWDLTDNPYPTWQKMEEMVEKGKIRNIGVSNFNIRRLQNLTANNLKIKPAINQVELNYWYPQPELLEWSRDHGILLEAYSPLGSAERVKETLQIPEVKHIAEKLNISPAQVYISWHIQRGTVVLPKSVTPERIEENFKVSRLPLDLFYELEDAANAHKPSRGSDPSMHWGVDIFE